MEFCLFSSLIEIQFCVQLKTFAKAEHPGGLYMSPSEEKPRLHNFHKFFSPQTKVFNQKAVLRDSSYTEFTKIDFLLIIRATHAKTHRKTSSSFSLSHLNCLEVYQKYIFKYKSTASHPSRRTGRLYK